MGNACAHGTQEADPEGVEFPKEAGEDNRTEPDHTDRSAEFEIRVACRGKCERFKVLPTTTVAEVLVSCDSALQLANPSIPCLLGHVQGKELGRNPLLRPEPDSKTSHADGNSLWGRKRHGTQLGPALKL